ncbi:rnhA operon protein [Halobium salinum]|uniref:RnhA operon protein n=1 Tax=Halobium salinum TaxID=1364940 RepID=A0ABD5P7G2_9EURY
MPEPPTPEDGNDANDASDTHDANDGSESATGESGGANDTADSNDTPDTPEDPPSFHPAAESELPERVVDEAERLTRLAESAVDGNEREAHLDRRATLLSEFDFTARVRDEDDTLVLHPAEWVVDGTVRVDRIDDTGRAVEVPLSGAGDEDDYEHVEAHNAGLVREVEAEHGAVHAANARAFADYMSNHYVRRLEEASNEEVAVFLREYYPRNAWPSTEQKSEVEASLAHLFEVAGTDAPGAVRRD